MSNQMETLSLRFEMTSGCSQVKVSDDDLRPVAMIDGDGDGDKQQFDIEANRKTRAK